MYKALIITRWIGKEVSLSTAVMEFSGPCELERAQLNFARFTKEHYPLCIDVVPLE